jgi:hypothetical protein
MPPCRFSGNVGRVTLRFDKCRMLYVTSISQCVFVTFCAVTRSLD